MKKKELKDVINQNGFFLHVNNLKPIPVEEAFVETNAITTSANVPKGDNIMVFRGLATQKFGVGEQSRNGYKIDVNGWDFSNYEKNPQILLQHNDNQPIGKAISLRPHENGVDINFYVDLKAMNEVDAHRVSTGLFSGLSTGHITHDVAFEHNDSGGRIPESQFLSLPYEERNNYTLVVTKAEMAEVSMVAIGSNPDALTLQNSLDIYFNKNIMPKIEKNEGAEEVKETTEATEETTSENTEKEEVAEQTSETTENSVEEETAEATEESEAVESTATEEETAENAETETVETTEAEANNVTIPKDLLDSLVLNLKRSEEKISELEKKVNAIPAKRTLKMMGKEDNKPKEGQAVLNLLKNSGLNY